MRGLGLALVGGAGAMVVWKIAENPALFNAVLTWLGTLATVIVTGFTVAVVMRYSRPRDGAPRPASPPSTALVIDQAGPYQVTPAQRQPYDSGRMELLPMHFTAGESAGRE